MAKVKKPPGADHLEMRLFAPGMSAVHRAGLGGLACTLKAMERQYKDGMLSKAKLPAPFDDGKPPWKIDEHSITLLFGTADNAAQYLENLFGFAYRIRKDGLISLPGSYHTEPSAAVLADLQLGLTLTFLQHGKVRTLAKELTPITYDTEVSDKPGVVVQYRKCADFKHQDGWKAFVDNKGCLVTGMLKIDGPLSPGSVVRHVAYTGDTTAEDPPARMLPLYFALVGCLPLPVNRGVAALLVPDVANLLDFVYDRPAMTPTGCTECQIANAADGALQAQIRLRGKRAIEGSTIPDCYAMTFRPTAWASQQKSRVATLHVTTDTDKMLDRFARALAVLPPRVVTRTVRESAGKGKNKMVTERQESFRSESVVRPLIAENLAVGRPWYAGFLRLMLQLDPVSGKPIRDKLSFERMGLHSMIADDTMWDSAGEATVVRAVHIALRSRYAQIAEENKTNPVAMRNRFTGEYDRWRLAFAGSKTADQFRTALCDLLSRGGRNEVLQKAWQEVLPLLRSTSWQYTRDLALLGLCSYQGRGDAIAESTTES